ncbi:MAG: hypothetical protein GF353_21685 [Candidatus Lokiarchaeota archaeon]|nr:hypothetical protein [Candidatus Lokiarchaeota archaeon]
MIYDFENKNIQIKIVYYGPAMSGKTTSLKYLFSHFNKINNIESIESTVGRTLFFDFGVLTFRGQDWGLKYLIYSATGQDFYAGTRPATLNGVDGIIFVADSQHNHQRENMRSWNELINLFGENIKNIPIVIALNKYDLCKTQNNGNCFIEKLNLNFFKNICVMKTIATRGYGILDSFKKMTNYLFPEAKLFA